MWWSRERNDSNEVRPSAEEPHMRDLVQSWWDAYDAAASGGDKAAYSGFGDGGGGYEEPIHPGKYLSIARYTDSKWCDRFAG